MISELKLADPKGEDLWTDGPTLKHVDCLRRQPSGELPVEAAGTNLPGQCASISRRHSENERAEQRLVCGIEHNVGGWQHG